MFEREIKVFRFSTGLLQRMSADIGQSQLGERANGVGHTPAWILGHIAVINDRAGRLLDLPIECPESWLQAFGPGRDENPDFVPAKEELLSAVRRAHDKLIDGLGRTNGAATEKPHGIALFANSPIVSVGDALANIMTGHQSLHVGQLSAWRRQMGFPPLF